MAKQHDHMTAPEVLKGVDERHKAFTAAATVQIGVATQYWLELVAYPPGSARSLWLLVGNAWSTWTIRTMGLRFPSKLRSVTILTV